MKTAIYATLLHSISTDAKPQHSKCPAGENSWCFYQSAIANGEKPNNHKLNVGTPINEKFLTKILPIYQRLASNELLERCIRCGTQNANESLHSMIWAKCPKEIFVNKRRVKRAVTEAVCEYNKGTVRTIVETQKALGVATGGSTKQLATILDCRKQKFRKRRQNAIINTILTPMTRNVLRHGSTESRASGTMGDSFQFRLSLYKTRIRIISTVKFSNGVFFEKLGIWTIRQLIAGTGHRKGERNVRCDLTPGWEKVTCENCVNI
ncbi:uncharacterized protein TNCV_5120671 [Trichonephila clavipes]|nr:uncharacterized protein TNCV_5120671 [Trichonephila clavipes]